MTGTNSDAWNEVGGCQVRALSEGSRTREVLCSQVTRCHIRGRAQPQGQEAEQWFPGTRQRTGCKGCEAVIWGHGNTQCHSCDAGYTARFSQLVYLHILNWGTAIAREVYLNKSDQKKDRYKYLILICQICL